MSGFNIVELLIWTLVAAMIVMIIMQADKVKAAIGSIGGWSLSEEGLLTGGKSQ